MFIFIFYFREQAGHTKNGIGLEFEALYLQLNYL